MKQLLNDPVQYKILFLCVMPPLFVLSSCVINAGSNCS